MNTLRRLFMSNRKYLRKFGFCEISGKRHIYEASSIGIYLHVFKRKTLAMEIGNIDEFKEKLKNVCLKHPNSYIFLSDIRKMIAVAENEDDLDLLYLLLQKYSSQEETLVFQKVTFGSEVMRLLYWMNKPNYAINFMEDKNLYGHIGNFTSVLIFLDMLFKNRMFNEVLKYYEYFQKNFRNHPQGLAVLYIAACFKLNTKESLKKAFAIYERQSQIPTKTMIRSTLLLASLALNHNLLSTTLEILNPVMRNNLAKNLVLLTLAKAKRSDEVVYLLRKCLAEAHKNDFFIIEEVLSSIEEELKDSADFNTTISQMKTGLNDFLVYQTLNDFLYEELLWQHKLVSGKTKSAKDGKTKPINSESTKPEKTVSTGMIN